MFRPVTERDADALADLDMYTWFPKELFPYAQTRHYAARLDVLHFLKSSTYGEVATLNGTVLGVVLGAVEGKRPLLPAAAEWYRQAHVNAPMVPGGIAVRHNLDKEIRTDLALEAGVRQEVPAELQLFIVSAAARGKGVGGRLYSRFLAHLRDCGAQRYFLYTDSDCDYGFYDAHGLTCVAQGTGDDYTGSGKTLDKFIYVGSSK
jgi:GNAT superfamily N-acetyltransferase